MDVLADELEEILVGEVGRGGFGGGGEDLVLVDFWATWCAPCLAELPNVQAAYAKYHDKGFEVISVSLDETDEAVRDFVEARKLPWPQVHNATCGGDVVAAYGVNNIPATFLVGPDGTVVRLEPRGKALEKALEPLTRK